MRIGQYSSVKIKSSNIQNKIKINSITTKSIRNASDRTLEKKKKSLNLDRVVSFTRAAELIELQEKEFSFL